MTEHASEITLTSMRSQHAGSAITCSTFKTGITFSVTLLTSMLADPTAAICVPQCWLTMEQHAVR